MSLAIVVLTHKYLVPYTRFSYLKRYIGNLTLTRDKTNL